MLKSENQEERAIVAVQDTLNSIKSRPHRQQVCIGVGSGLIAGYIFAKIGRAAALLLGGSLIALQCAVQQDVIHINWRKVGRAGDQLKSSTPILGDKRTLKKKIMKTIDENRVFFGSFGGGFLIAVSFA